MSKKKGWRGIPKWKKESVAIATLIAITC